MAPETHLLLSWVIAVKATGNPRDCRLVALAGVLPDADGLGLLADWANEGLRHKQTHFYTHYHHYLLHGAFGAAVLAALLACFARRRWRVALLALLVVHLHILCDLAGSRGPSKEDLWPIFYLGPFDHEPMWLWKGQWPLDAWPNRLLGTGMLVWAIFLAIKHGHSFVGVFNRRLDVIFVGVLQKWHKAWITWRSPPPDPAVG
jgi:inner membrane protein